MEKAKHEMKRGTLKSGTSGKKVNYPKQAIATGLSEAGKALFLELDKAAGNTPQKRYENGSFKIKAQNKNTKK